MRDRRGGIREPGKFWACSKCVPASTRSSTYSLFPAFAMPISELLTSGSSSTPSSCLREHSGQPSRSLSAESLKCIVARIFVHFAYWLIISGLNSYPLMRLIERVLRSFRLFDEAPLRAFSAEISRHDQAVAERIILALYAAKSSCPARAILILPGAHANAIVDALIETG